MSDYLLIHNPKCSKSRKTLEILNSKGIEPKLFLYLNEEFSQDLTEDFLNNIFDALGMNPADCLRKKEEDFLNSDIDLSDRKSIISGIMATPKILERPIVLKGNKAVIGRPPENVLSLI